ncbi:hypothetical protein M438DRAFT_349286 [Aureobasidium pullulans EXF-150]|uniref:Uncharacterized protein n=1 Tax=Aureobasidium pullulans EXF-150 TaxID=1043002 RepID=A0A074XDC9_AURPU|nr:uncharacterized protein M438DRAFT_349286 [Aureobasidium pullulans EXF-150]KEQ80042.1 hypothetical protein M438DRAFT_349286 [Aureobasidium pullulans EXF-150]
MAEDKSKSGDDNNSPEADDNNSESGDDNKSESGFHRALCMPMDRKRWCVAELCKGTIAGSFKRNWSTRGNNRKLLLC